jgi:hypothetical protein
MWSRVYTRERLDEIPPPVALIRGILDAGVVGLLAGKFGTYKSFVSVAWACSVATGLPWLGHDVVTPGNVVYVAAEGATGLRSRVRAWEAEHFGGARVGNLTVYHGRVNLLDPEQVSVFGEIAAKHEPELVVIDTLHKCAPGADEDKSKDMGPVLDRAFQLVEDLGCHVLFNHHTGHGGERSRGSSSLEDDVDNSWVIRLSGDPEDRSPDNQRVMTHRKVKDGELHGEIPLALKPVSLGPAPAASGDAFGRPASPAGSAVVTRGDGDEADDGIAWMMPRIVADKLDAAGVPRGLTARRTEEAGRELGIFKRTSVWAAVARLRKIPARGISAIESEDQ